MEAQVPALLEAGANIVARVLWHDPAHIRALREVVLAR
jgi:hypothetical protein